MQIQNITLNNNKGLNLLFIKCITKLNIMFSSFMNNEFMTLFLTMDNVEIE